MPRPVQSKHCDCGRAQRSFSYGKHRGGAEYYMALLPGTMSKGFSVNGGKWTAMVADSPIAFGGTDGDLRLRGKSPNGTSDGNAFYRSYNVQFGKTDVKVRCKGDIRTLIDYENYETVSTGDARFSWLFNHAEALARAPELPITELATACYYGMFQYTSLLLSRLSKSIVEKTNALLCS